MTCGLLAIAALWGWLHLRAEEPKPTWTILVYGHGDHNLAPSLVNDIKEMQKAGSANGFNIVVQADFDASQADDLVEAGLPAKLAEGTTRLLVRHHDENQVAAADVVERLPELNHDEPGVLTDFITWAVKKYPADHYGLVLWDHGGQWEGYGGDTQDGTIEETGGMSTARIRDAIQSAMKSASVSRWEFIAFDTCLMGGAEVLGDFTSLTDLFIGCPEIDFGDGWNYSTILSWLKEHPSASALEFGRKEAEAWKEHHMQADKVTDTVLAAHGVFDLKKYAEFERAFASFATALTRAATADNLRIPIQRRRSNEYSISEVINLGDPTEFIDLGDFVERVAQDPKADAGLRESARRLTTSIDSLVVAKVQGSSRKSGHGLSVWYPVNGWGENMMPAEEEEEIDDDDAGGETEEPARSDFPENDSAERFHHYQETSFARQTPWSLFLARVHENFLHYAANPPSLENLLPETANELTASVQKPARIPVRIAHGEGAFQIMATVVDDHMTKNRKDHVFLGQIGVTDTNGPGKHDVSWDSRLPVIELENGKIPVFLGGVYMEAGHGLITSYAKLYPKKGKRGKDIILITQIENDRGRIIDILDAGDEDTPPSSIEVDPGDTLRPVYYAQRRNGDNPAKWAERQVVSRHPILVPPEGIKGIPVRFKPLKAGTYRIDIHAEDVYGSESDVLEYEVRVGE
jgi:hypothetical protein